MGLGLVALLQLSALFTIYDTVYWRDVRMLAPTLISLFFGLILFSKQWAQRVLIVQLGLFYFVINYTDGWVASHRKTYQAAQLNNYREDFIKVGKLVKGESIVMLRRSFAHEGQTYLFALPFKNTEGLPIRYSVYYAPLETAPNHLHDYMILPQKIFRDNNEIVLLEENATFNLYKVNKPILSRERSKN